MYILPRAHQSRWQICNILKSFSASAPYPLKLIQNHSSSFCKKIKFGLTSLIVQDKYYYRFFILL